MALKKADLDPVYKHIEKDAKKIVLDWFQKSNLHLENPKSIFLTWMGIVPTGYRCMVTSTEYENYYFEISKNMKNGETICTCLQRFEYVVKPSQYEKVEIHRINNQFFNR